MKCAVVGCPEEATVGAGSLALCDKHWRKAVEDITGNPYPVELYGIVADKRIGAQGQREDKRCATTKFTYQDIQSQQL